MLVGVNRYGALVSLMQHDVSGDSHVLLYTNVTNTKDNWAFNELIQAKQRSVFTRECRRKCKWSSSRTLYCSNSTASFNILICGDVHPQPGPIADKTRKKNKCHDCERTIAKNHRYVCCSECKKFWHLKCAGLTSKSVEH